MTYFGRSRRESCGVKYPLASHQSYHAASTAVGLYESAILCEKSFSSPFGLQTEKK
jgi:hypothetical protein